MVVHPVAGGTETSLVEFAHSNHGVLGLSVDRVAVNVQVGRELVVLLDLLKLRKGVSDQGRVEDADVRRRLRVIAQGTRLGIRDRLVRRLRDIRDAVCVSRCLNVSLNIGRLNAARARLDLEALHDPRVNAPDQDATHEQQGCTHDGKAPPADDCGDDEQHGNDRGDSGEDRATGDHRIDIGVGRASNQVG